jgi:hypothetical protein
MTEKQSEVSWFVLKNNRTGRGDSSKDSFGIAVRWTWKYGDAGNRPSSVGDTCPRTLNCVPLISNVAADGIAFVYQEIKGTELRGGAPPSSI